MAANAVPVTVDPLRADTVRDRAERHVAVGGNRNEPVDGAVGGRLDALGYR